MKITHHIQMNMDNKKDMQKDNDKWINLQSFNAVNVSNC